MVYAARGELANLFQGHVEQRRHNRDRGRVREQCDALALDRLLEQRREGHHSLEVAPWVRLARHPGRVVDLSRGRRRLVDWRVVGIDVGEVLEPRGGSGQPAGHVVDLGQPRLDLERKPQRVGRRRGCLNDSEERRDQERLGTLVRGHQRREHVLRRLLSLAPPQDRERRVPHLVAQRRDRLAPLGVGVVVPRAVADQPEVRGRARAAGGGAGRDLKRLGRPHGGHRAQQQQGPNTTKSHRGGCGSQGPAAPRRGEEVERTERT
mmetsp:Transcript_64828/g.180160  ORF Transcript_64828/g.180160 Transcript_64828/m.180160 type:complete len:264 (+) Transcript_64828:367-1158(+)